MRFVDASVFLYAYLLPKKAVPNEIAEMKKAARAILRRINTSEKVYSSLIHLSEVANILEAVTPVDESLKIMRDLLYATTLVILEPTNGDYLDAIEVAHEAGVGLNDGLAYVLMKATGVREIYSFDRHFDRFDDIERICE
jgi:predicted nucleic acid-binding protein